MSDQAPRTSHARSKRVPAIITVGVAGLMLGTSSQIERAAVFGDRTYAADLSAYREEILRGIGAEP